MTFQILFGRPRLVLLGVVLAGCSRVAGGLNPPNWDGAAAAERALSEYDANGDHKLSRDELKKCPGLLFTLKAFDTDGDQAISAEELKTKLEQIRAQQAAIVEVPCTVTRGGQPLEGATVTFVPESFMGEAFKPVAGVSTSDGSVYPSVPDELLPTELRGRIHGIHCGVYRVTVTHPKFGIPAKYNTQTELGWVVLTRSHDALRIDL